MAIGKSIKVGPAKSLGLNDKIPNALNSKIIRQKKMPVKATDNRNAFGKLWFMYQNKFNSKNMILVRFKVYKPE